jgi:hypothetical protein
VVQVRATAVRWESDHFPGVIEVVVVDAHRREHRIIEKLPVLTMLDITADSAFPIELWIDAELDGVDGDEVAVTFSHGVETIDGAQGLTVSSADVI